MGHRIELGEIESAAMALSNVKNACCLFEKDSQKIILVIESDDATEEDILEKLKKRLQRYMLPNKLVLFDKIPLTQSGKVDRVKVKDML